MDAFDFGLVCVGLLRRRRQATGWYDDDLEGDL